MKKKMIFLDGFMIPATSALVRVLSPGILSGLGVFETMRAYAGKIFALTAHLDRLFDGLKTLRLEPPCPAQKLQQYLQKSLDVNQLESARIRLIVWKGKQGMRISIAAFAYRPFSHKKYQQGFSAVFSDIRRDESAVTSRIKSINYLPLLMAQRKAKAAGHDEAVLLNRRGRVAEASKANIFLVKDGQVTTPTIACGCLEGVTRKIILKLARREKIICQEMPVSPKELLKADEIFLSNSLIEVMPLTRLQGHPISRGQIGPVTQKLLSVYREHVAKELGLG